ncbi:hypothetical protein DH2020_033711 [Rehmannia glutinosa]|uniref:Thioredoxin domain-containing protein n=1 Tax=Rehmannia glutinosa TaxID=99300 RepID=A0ABR0VBQ6_REHGL
MSSHSGKTMSEVGLETLSDRLRNTLTHDEGDNGVNVNKPDFRELDLGSPVSPLRTRNGGGLAVTTTTTTSSSSSSSGSITGRTSTLFNSHTPRKSESNPNSHSGELSVESSPSAARNFKPGHTRSRSCGILKTGMASRSTKPDILGSGSGNYGHGSIMRGGLASKPGSDSGPTNYSRGLMVGGEPGRRTGVCSSNDPEELKRMGNDNYKNGHFAEALTLYDKAIAISPANAAYHFNRAAALMGLRRLVEAVRECEEAIRLDPGYVRAHHRLGSLLLSLGQVENARKHICYSGHQPDPVDFQKLQSVEKHLSRCTDARRVGDWRSTLREVDAAIASGADASPQLCACRAEALLKLHQLDDAFLALSNIPKSEPSASPHSPQKIFGMHFDAYMLFIRTQVELSKGRFDSALTAIEKAGQIDPNNVEISILLNNVKLVCRARARGNDLFKSERFTEACSAYGEGLRLDPSILFCTVIEQLVGISLVSGKNQWMIVIKHSVSSPITPKLYLKGVLKQQAVRDYEILRRELPDDKEVAESLFHAQVALKKSRGASLVHFKTGSNVQCRQISPFLDTLCTRYPSVNFLMVDIEESPAIAHAENIRIVPTIKIYRKGNRVKEMVCPSPEVLESSARLFPSLYSFKRRLLRKYVKLFTLDPLLKFSEEGRTA